MTNPPVGTFVKYGNKANSPGWIVAENGCHIWTGARSHGGYGIAVVDGLHTSAHRVRYMREVGPIPEGMVLDHYVCDNGAGGCCNPLHCRPATHRENNLRSNSPSAWNATKTRCPEGHPLEGDNLAPQFLRKGRRVCRTCLNARKRRYYRRDKALSERQVAA